MEKKKNKKKSCFETTEKIISPIFFVAFCTMIFLGLFLFTLDIFYADTFFPRTTIAGVDVTGKSKMESVDYLKNRLEDFRLSFTFNHNGMEQKYYQEDMGINVDIEASVKIAYEIGRDPLTTGSVIDRVRMIAQGGIEQDLVYHIDADTFNNFIKNKYLQDDTTSHTTLKYFEGNFEKVTSEPKHVVNQKYLLALINNKINSLSLEPIAIPTTIKSSTITDEELVRAQIETRKIVASDFTITFEDESYTLPPSRLSEWVDFTTKEHRELEGPDYLTKDNFDIDNFILNTLGFDDIITDNHDKVLTAALNREVFGEYLALHAADIDIKAQNAKFLLKQNGLELIEDSKKGRELLIDGNYEDITRKVLTNERTHELLTRETGADINADNIDDLGIMELVASGESDFSGSPRNRKHNIAVAAEKLNGILIQPNEEFRLVENIGEINAEAGYLPELVIKQNKTVPEYGGGLCQIATTNFRAAVNAGFEITERKNHSYAVHYYDPQGTDATIYSPRPDLRFVNDTGNHILMQTKIDGDKLSFEFYGTKDNREVILDGPHYWDRRASGALKARWNQKVMLDGMLLREQEFISVYDSPANYH